MLRSMIRAIGRRLRLVLHQPDELGTVRPVGAENHGLPEVEFVAYAEDGRLSGRIRLDASRLSDMLNNHDEFLLEDILAERLPDGGTMLLPEFLVRREELILVHATGPRGDRAQRTRTVTHGIALRAGPYLVNGDLHAAPGMDPLVFFRRRRPMVPLTDATVEYRAVESPVQEFAGTIVVNRDHIDWVRETEDGLRAVELPAITSTALGSPRR